METVQESSVNLIKIANSGSILPSHSVAQSLNTTNSNLSDNKTPNKQGRPPKSLLFTSEATLNNRNMLEYLKRKREDTALDLEPTEDTETASQAAKQQNMLQPSPTKAQDTPVCLENKSTDEILRILVGQIGAMREEAKTNTTSLENRIQQSQSENQKSIQALRKDYPELKSTWSDKWTKMQERQAKLEAEIAELKAAKTNTEYTRLEKENNSCIDEINSKIKCLEDMTEIYEKSWRKLNIIVKNHNWSNSNLLKQAQEFFNRNFNLNNPVSKIKPLDRNFKILRIKLADENTKAIILKNKALNLKESKISIMQDLTKRELQTFKKLQQVARKQKELGKKIKLKGLQLRIEDT
ncbi:early endosome antigen 1-like [Cotesia glomerata]|uniref:early endosome antigen 1-like n=1 Tax=Cotesia glomerata TaxID=32391 RepID=UPI001D023C89|nr:early endosome antigen 1-like [Cotesia glomerata]